MLKPWLFFFEKLLCLIIDYNDIWLLWQMNASSAGPSSKSKAGLSQPSETSFKRKRGIFQKECEYLKWVCFVGFIAEFYFMTLLLFFFGFYSAAYDVWFWRWSKCKLCCLIVYVLCFRTITTLVIWLLLRFFECDVGGINLAVAAIRLLKKKNLIYISWNYDQFIHLCKPSTFQNF